MRNTKNIDFKKSKGGVYIMDSGITLEKVDQVVDRTGVSYEEAKAALENSQGNVVDAIIAIERRHNSKFDEINTRISEKGSDIIEKLREALKRGNITKVIIEKDGEVLLNLPVTVGAIGVILAPVAAIIGVSAAMITKFRIKIVKDDGEVVDLNDLTEEKISEFREKMPFSKKEKEDDIEIEINKSEEDKGEEK